MGNYWLDDRLHMYTVSYETFYIARNERHAAQLMHEETGISPYILDGMGFILIPDDEFVTVTDGFGHTCVQRAVDWIAEVGAGRMVHWAR